MGSLQASRLWEAWPYKSYLETRHCSPEAPVFVEEGPFSPMPLCSKWGSWSAERPQTLTATCSPGFPAWTLPPYLFCFALSTALPSCLPPPFSLSMLIWSIFVLLFSLACPLCVQNSQVEFVRMLMSSDVYNPKESLMVSYNKMTWMSVFCVGKASQVHSTAITMQCIMYNL